MRVCIFTPNFLPAIGGTEVVTDQLARQLHAMGHRVVVLALARGETAGVSVPYGVEWYRKPIAPRVFPERVGKHLAALHQREGFDVFLCNYGVPTGYAARKLSDVTGVPTVIVSHGSDLHRTSDDRRRPHLWKRTLWAYRHAHGLIAISPHIEERIREINPNPPRFELIPNGVDIAGLNDPAPRPRDFTDPRPFMLCLGNLVPIKGFDTAIAAFAKVRDRLGGRVLVVVGSGREEAALKAQAARLGVSDRVLFLGKRTGDDKRWLLQHCEFGLMPSIEEGHPIVGLEFLAVGKPIICSLNRAFDGMYDHDVNALRVPAQDDAVLADAMVAMTAKDLAAMGAESRRRAEAYAWPLIATRYEAFLERVIREAKAPAAGPGSS